MNDEIRVPEVRLIDADGTAVGVVKIEEAMQKAQDAGVDLIEISPKAVPPVCKVMDYSKYRYLKDKKIKEAKKKQHMSQVKEVRIRPRIGQHDLDVKIRHIQEFIERKDQVKISIIFYGRENAHRELGNVIVEKVKLAMEPAANIEDRIMRQGNRISFMVTPKK
ncbi:MAG: translation initiation factor IF-3 [bacterium]